MRRGRANRPALWLGTVLLCFSVGGLAPAAESSVCEHAEGCAADDQGDFQPSVSIVQGETLACSESATVFFEYEVWHVDPADSMYSVEVSMHVLPKPTHGQGDECEAEAGQDEPFFFTPGYVEHVRHLTQGVQGQVLIKDGGLPSWGVPVSRLEEGVYLVRLRLLHEGGGGEGKTAVSEGVAVVRIMPGRGSCLRRSMATEYCSHSAVAPILEAIQLVGTANEEGDGPAADGSADGRFGGELFDYVQVQTLSGYGRSLNGLIERAHAAALERADSSAFFFVEIGANDGKFADPIYPHVRAKGWHGLLVEPLPDVFEILRSHYDGVPTLRFEQAAIVDEEEEGAPVSITRVPLADVQAMEEECQGRPDAEMCRYAIGVGTLKPDDKSHWILAEKGVRQDVPAMSLATLLDKHGVTSIDLFQVDAEGYDGRIVMQLDLDKYRPALVQMEADHLGGQELGRIMLRFAEKGYRMRTFGGDLVAYLPHLQP